MAKALWENFGLTVFDVENLPWQMVEDIHEILQLEQKHQEAENRRAQARARQGR